MSVYGNRMLSVDTAEELRAQRDRAREGVRKLRRQLEAERDPDCAGSLACQLKRATDALAGCERHGRRDCNECYWDSLMESS